nr:GAF and ANTAR domain-containing protein [Rhodococcus ruber]
MAVPDRSSAEHPPVHAFERRLGGEIERLARQVRTAHADLGATLEVITRAAVELIPGAEHAGITLITRGKRFESRAATSELPRRVDDLQHDLQDGPCIQAIWEHETVLVDDMDRETRWPTFAPRSAQLGSGATLAFRLYTTEDNLGALNLHSCTAHAFDDTSISIGTSIATHAAIAVIAAQREEQFRAALASRDLLGQAKGMLMERFSVDADHAFALLRKLSQNHNEPVFEIARKLVDTAHPPQPDHP